jgi:CheY-like chemotaxis protein
MDHPSTPRILLADDEPVSLAFLDSALRELGCDVEAVPDGDAARSAAFEREFDLLLLDHRMPGLDGDRLLGLIRANAHGPNLDIPAIATTADPDPRLQRQLRNAGFQRVLLKPLGMPLLREVLCEAGLAAGAECAVLLDDEAGLGASGSAQALAALRELFARELDALANEWGSLRDDESALDERLHRLRAACGFCGAPALQSAAEKLSVALGGAGPVRIEESRAEFRRALAATRKALERL